MTRIRFEYIHEFRDRHGKVRRYFRRPGLKRIPLPGLPGSDEFMTAYQAALSGVSVERPAIGASLTKPGSVSAAIVGYYQSTEFRSLAASTQRGRRSIFERFREEHGGKGIATLPADAIARMLANKGPEAARNWFKALRGLLQFAVAHKFRRDDPTEGIKIKKPKTDGYAPWTEDLVTRYRTHYALGSQARLAIELLLGTGQRRGDVVRMGRQHARNGAIEIRQEKTGVLVQFPILPELQVALDAMPASDHLPYLATDTGRPFKPNYFTHWFQVQCDAAGVPRGYSAHGLRKLAATCHANNGATAHELMAWFGWTTLEEAERYTRAADRRRLAASTGEKIRTATPFGKPKPPVCQRES